MVQNPLHCALAKQSNKLAMPEEQWRPISTMRACQDERLIETRVPIYSHLIYF